MDFLGGGLANGEPCRFFKLGATAAVAIVEDICDRDLYLVIYDVSLE